MWFNCYGCGFDWSTNLDHDFAPWVIDGGDNNIVPICGDCCKNMEQHLIDDVQTLVESQEGNK